MEAVKVSVLDALSPDREKGGVPVARDPDRGGRGGLAGQLHGVGRGRRPRRPSPATLADSTTPVSSSSATVTGRSFLTSPYSSPSAVWVRVSRSFTASSSWAAVTVTVRGLFQLEAVKVRVLTGAHARQGQVCA